MCRLKNSRPHLIAKMVHHDLSVKLVQDLSQDIVNKRVNQGQMSSIETLNNDSLSFMEKRLIISPGQSVLIRLPSEGMKIVDLKPSGTVSLGKFGTFDVEGVFGYPHGTSFEIMEDHHVQPIKSITYTEDTTDETDDLNKEILDKTELTKLFSESADNNQNIIDIGSKIQKLTDDEIIELKQSGASSNIGQKIIEQMIAGHQGFDRKTIYSQEKYFRRKQQKFLRRFTIEYLGGSQLLNYYVEKDLQRILDMSEESLGLILNYGNVRPGGTYLLIDETGGVILYAMMERMQGEGTIVYVHENEHPNTIALRYSGYSDELIQKMVKPISFLQLLEPENEKIDWIEPTEQELEQAKPGKRIQLERRSKRANEINSVISMVQKGNFDGFISVCTLHMPTLLPHILPMIGGSRPIVIYNQFKELLLETQHYISSDKRVLAPSIFESRVRPFQTIPGRMHPRMTMKGYGGYVLWATKVIPIEGGVQAVGRGIIKKKRDEESTTSKDQALTSQDEAESSKSSKNEDAMET